MFCILLRKSSDHQRPFSPISPTPSPTEESRFDTTTTIRWSPKWRWKSIFEAMELRTWHMRGVQRWFFFVESKQFWIEDHHWSTTSGSLSKLSSVESTPLAVWVAQILFDYWLQIVVFSMQIWDSATSEISKQSKNNIQVITRFFVVIMRGPSHHPGTLATSQIRPEFHFFGLEWHAIGRSKLPKKCFSVLVLSRRK